MIQRTYYNKDNKLDSVDADNVINVTYKESSTYEKKGNSKENYFLFNLMSFFYHFILCLSEVERMKMFFLMKNLSGCYCQLDYGHIHLK